ncbi:MAG: hypothetical protein QXR84_07265 [Candidatus Bathyarchaeia archaeon]|nr:hypothetical protein [Candidatus Bathyarchaeota archaeon]
MSYKYRRFIKPLRVGEAPVDLLPPEKFFWAESKDLEGYPGHFYIGYVTEPRTLHPTNEKLAVKHPYDELLIFAGINTDDILDLGAEISVMIGEEGEEHIIKDPSVVIVPKDVFHGPIKVNKLERPIVHIALCDAPEYKTEFKRRERYEAKGTKYSRLIKKLTTSKTAYEGYLHEGPITIDERGVMDLRAIGPGEAYQIVQMHPEDLEGVNISFSWEFFKTTGVWMSTRLAHVHPEPELLIAIGLDPNNIYNLGASIEFWFGSEREVYVIDKPTVISIPRAWIPHTPVVTQRVDRPFAFMLVCPGRYTRAGYVETGWDV